MKLSANEVGLNKQCDVAEGKLTLCDGDNISFNKGTCISSEGVGDGLFGDNFSMTL